MDWTHLFLGVFSSPFARIKIEEFIVDYCSSGFSVQNHTYPKGVSLHFFIFGLFMFFSVLKKPAPHLLYPFICCWTFSLFPCPGYCKQRCSDNWGADRQLLGICCTVQGTQFSALWWPRAWEWGEVPKEKGYMDIIHISQCIYHSVVHHKLTQHC